ncbi:MAG: phosphotransferase, partial [bacterium]
VEERDVRARPRLEEDLGDTTLFSYLSTLREKEGFSEEIIRIYEKVVELLPQFQIVAGKKLDYSLCYPRESFDKQSMMWDLNYFKYYFLKLAKIPFDEQYLEDDFQKFTDFLLQADRDFFLYRDFQSRNIMIRDGQPYFIDYQGGRKGALQYDIASLLFDAKADIPQEVRDLLLEKYIDSVSKLVPVDRKKFMQFYYGYVLIRIMQALGAYGFRGFYERKAHFLKSVPYAIQNLEWLLRTAKLPVELPALTDAWERLVRSSFLRQLGDAELRMTVRIQSFSYKRGIPIDEKGHGGGFVFDCRLLPNPGRLPEYADLTGNDAKVISYLQNEREVDRFFNHIKSIVDQAIANYQSRNFTDLMVLFGCTGGQHRSVYMANLLVEYLEKKHNVNVEMRHRELEFIKK